MRVSLGILSDPPLLKEVVDGLEAKRAVPARAKEIFSLLRDSLFPVPRLRSPGGLRGFRCPSTHLRERLKSDTALWSRSETSKNARSAMVSTITGDTFSAPRSRQLTPRRRRRSAALSNTARHEDEGEHRQTTHDRLADDLHLGHSTLHARRPSPRCLDKTLHEVGYRHLEAVLAEHVEHYNAPRIDTGPSANDRPLIPIRPLPPSAKLTPPDYEEPIG